MKTSNLLIFIFVFPLVKASKSEPMPTVNKTLETAHYTCLLGSDIKIEPIKDSLDGIYTDDDKQLIQYFQCMFRMYNLLDVQGNLKNEAIFDAIHGLEKDQSYTENATAICQDDKMHNNVTQHEIAYEFFKCFRNYTDSAYYWSILKYLLSKQSSIYMTLTPTKNLKLETVHYTCSLGSDIQLQPIKDALNGIFNNSTQLDEYFGCVFRMYGFLDVEGNIKNSTMFSSIPRQDKNKIYTEEAIKECQQVETQTKNKIAFEFFKCFRNSTDEAEYWTTLNELTNKKNDKLDVSNVLVDFL